MYKARFDEENNLATAEMMKRAGLLFFLLGFFTDSILQKFQGKKEIWEDLDINEDDLHRIKEELEIY